MTGEMAPIGASIWQWLTDIAPTVSKHLSRPLVEVSPLWVHVNVIATLNSTIYVILLLCLAFATTQPTPVPLPPTSLYTLAQY